MLRLTVLSLLWYDNILKSYLERITRNPKICGGQPVIRGTRVPVKTVLASLAEGSTIGEILASFPTVTEADIWAVVAFAAASAVDDLPLLEVPVLV